ncbi:hypothetical protein OKW30_001179 [Paraburkholderia sp. Clong3]|uniref:hypothetical protein n=1 Tax=Paraburkholderia sp. Clong3 TaxID=2991061 RepID=UPI003D1B44A6
MTTASESGGLPLLDEDDARADAQLRTLAAHLKQLSEDLFRLVERDLSFLSVDAQVLLEHPEIVASAKTQAGLDAAMRVLDELSETWWRLAEDGKAAHDACCAALAKAPPRFLT